MSKTLVYGLHTDYQNYKDWIHSHYDVQGCVDQDVTRLPKDIGITKENLKNRIHEFDTILITADPVSILQDLIDEYNVPLEKIRVLFYEVDKDNKAKMKFYGNEMEDAALLLLFEELGYKDKPVRYVEIGTNDPVKYNATFNFYKHNLKTSGGGGGILVDPLPTVGDLAKIIRPQDRFINAAISAKSGEDVTFYACKSSTVSSLTESHHSKFDGQSHNNVKEIKVKLIGINELLEQVEFQPDFLLVDAEGEDDKIIKALDFHRFSPKVIMVEVNNIDCGRDGMLSFMSSKGYEEWATVEQNVIFVKKKH